MKIKEWKILQIKEKMGGGYLKEIVGITAETEYAVLVKMVWGYTSGQEKRIEEWIPKSIIAKG